MINRYTSDYYIDEFRHYRATLENDEIEKIFDYGKINLVACPV